MARSGQTKITTKHEPSQAKTKQINIPMIECKWDAHHNNKLEKIIIYKKLQHISRKSFCRCCATIINVNNKQKEKKDISIRPFLVFSPKFMCNGKKM